MFVGMELIVLLVIFILIVIYIVYKFGEYVFFGFVNGGFYGIVIVIMGMFLICVYILVMDIFGLIIDNVGGIIEMLGVFEEVRNVIDRFDVCGNIIKVLIKGYVIGFAVFVIFLFFFVYFDEVKKILGRLFEFWFFVDIGKFEVFIGVFIGVMVVYFFSLIVIRVVGRAV